MIKNKLNNIQVLRGLSAVLVCCFHAKNLLNHYNNLGELLFKRGMIGVAIFFILSGFIIDYTAKDKVYTRANIIKYFIARCTRIIPLYYLLTLVYILLVLDTSSFFNDGYGRLIKTFLFIPYETMPPLYVGWSLNYEMFFYLLFGMFLLFNRYRFFLIIGAILGLTLVVPVLMDQVQFSNGNSSFGKQEVYNLITSSLLFQFALGIVLSKIYKYLKFKKIIAIAIAAVLTTVFLLFYFSKITFYKYDVIFCGILVLGFLILDKNNWQPKIKLWVKLGDISYSFYLVHPIVIILMERGVKNFNLNINNGLLFGSILVVSYYASIVLHKHIEVKFTAYIRKKLQKEATTNP